MTKTELISFFVFLAWLSILVGPYGCEASAARIITSPGFPGSYPANSLKEWTVEVPKGMQAIMSVRTVSLESPWDTLSVNHTSPLLQGSVFAYVRSSPTAFVFPSGVTTIRFCSDTIVQKTSGFELEYMLSEFTLKDDNDRQLLTSVGRSFQYLGPVYTCESGPQFVNVEAQCDGVFDCADYSDEKNCATGKAFQRRCGADAYYCRGYSDFCIPDTRLCDGWTDCPSGDDEVMCTSLKCPLGCSCGESVFIGRYGPEQPQCSGADWLPFWVNCTTGWDEDYTRNTSRKAILLNLKGAPINELRPGVFVGLRNVHTIDISSANLTRFPPGMFDGLDRLVKIIADNNSLTYLERGAFRHLFNLRLLYLDINKIARLDDGCFLDLHNLFFIGMENNSLSDIRPGTFADLGQSLERLVLPANNITSINSSLFDGIREKLLLVSFEDNPLSTIVPGTFQNLSILTDLYLLLRPRTPLRLYPEIYDGLDSLQSLFVYDPRLCCIAPSGVECNQRVPPEPLFTCRMTFLHNAAIKFFMWLLGFAALVGNTIVIVSRLRLRHTSTISHVQSILISNLAVSDFIMGLYMLILAASDVYIGESYFWEDRSHEWRTSSTCRFAGFLSFLSCETSVFLITVISVDRFICIVFPYTKKRLTVRSSHVLTAAIWLLALILSITSVLLSVLDPDAYDLSDVCVGLPLIRKNTNLMSTLDEETLTSIGIKQSKIIAASSASTWQFSTAIFLGVNLVCFTVTVAVYIAVFIKVRRASSTVGRKKYSSNEVKMAIKLSLIVATDFFCWMPVIILGIAVQANDVYVSPNLYAWLVAFVLPINSAINPFLYTLVDRYADKLKSSISGSSESGDPLPTKRSKESSLDASK
ncbi:uncharacterized protein [Diadema setosum]|uniref:uncharacterized protein n=1 Tax=Diadema setosum TaxID=31175 RepID=UPI003B3B81A8